MNLQPALPRSGRSNTAQDTTEHKEGYRICMGDTDADTNPFRRLAEQERAEQAQNGSATHNYSGAKPSSPAITLIDIEREPPSVEQGELSDSSYSQLVDSYVHTDDGGGSTSSDDDDDREELALMEIPPVISATVNNHSEYDYTSKTQLNPSANVAIIPENNGTFELLLETQHMNQLRGDRNDLNDSPPPPAPPVRPPKLPQRQQSSFSSSIERIPLVKKVSQLDPGTSSTVSTYSFPHIDGPHGNGSRIDNRYGIYGPDTYSDPIPQFSQSNSIPSANTSIITPSLSINIPAYSSEGEERPQTSASMTDMDLTPTNSTHILPSSGDPPMSSPLPSVSLTGGGSSIPVNKPIHNPPVINIIEPTNDKSKPPPLPKKPQLPQKPTSLLGSRSLNNSSAYELLESYSRRASISSFSHSREPSSSTLDPETLRDLGITEEMIQQQKEIEERIERERQQNIAQRLPSVPDIHVSGLSNDLALNPHVTATSSSSINDSASIRSTSTGDIPDDVSQLEIPTSLSRSQSNMSGESMTDGDSTVSTEGSIDVFAAGGDLTEEQFLSYLPPVPAYREHASETELTVPNGKAIELATVNENHPEYNPPEYTSVSGPLKEIVRRPQFSQTGGDTISYRREQQRMEREQTYRLQAQQHLQPPQRPPRPHRRRSSLSTGGTTRRRLPPLPESYVTGHPSQRW